MAVVAGCDTGIVLTDALSGRLSLSGNNSETSMIQRDKYLMHTTLNKHGLHYISTAVFRSFKEFSESSIKFHDGTSFVIKPINSACSEGVRFAEGPQGVVEAMKASAWGQDNILGEVNAGFVVQPFIRGLEFVVDMIATGDEFFIASVC